MHELAITQKIVEIIRSESERRRVLPVKAVIEIGSMSTFKPEPIEHYFRVICKGSSLSSMKLEFIEGEGTDVKVKEMMIDV